VVNPTVVVEVLSPGTETYDRGEKLEHYQRVPSLHECVLVSHRERQIESWRREPGGGWSHRAAGAGQTLRIEALGCVLVVDEIYRGVLDTPGT
jgi:Uma2 family endonuclease